MSALDAAFDRILHTDIDANHYEHNVATWCLTKMKDVFKDPKWAITPEARDPHSKKIPDLLVEEAVETADNRVILRPYLYVELKSESGDSIVKALEQITKVPQTTIDDMGGNLAVFAIVQKGTDLAFFEYHPQLVKLQEEDSELFEDMQHYKGFVSLTQDFIIKKRCLRPAVVSTKNFRPYINFEFYQVLCCIDLQEDTENSVDKLFKYIEENSTTHWELEDFDSEKE